ncbi:MAG: aldo/keto reductase [Anaerolineae bacterium]|nr:aldo/keto reductase [Anaerolineae bacterium]
MDYADFGNTGLRVSRLSIGTGTSGWRGKSEQTALGLEGLSGLLCRAYDSGVTFWDTADGYGSHRHVARALKTVPRDQVVIATKTTARNEARMEQDIERFLRELNTDVLDIVLMHCITQAKWEKRFAGAMAALSRAKEQGKVRAVGISCHDLGALRTAAASTWTEVVLVRINYAGINMDGRPEGVTPIIEQLYASGKAVYGMKVFGAGRLTQNPRAALEYVFKLGAVHAVTIGISNPEQLQQDVRLVEEIAPQYPLEKYHQAR